MILCKAFPTLGTPTQAFKHYNLFSDHLDGLTGEELMQLDMACLSEYNLREKEAYDKQKKDGDWAGKHPGAEAYPDKETMWEKARKATKKKDDA
jgi:hypothetical protein